MAIVVTAGHIIQTNASELTLSTRPNSGADSEQSRQRDTNSPSLTSRVLMSAPCFSWGGRRWLSSSRPVTSPKPKDLRTDAPCPPRARSGQRVKSPEITTSSPHTSRALMSAPRPPRGGGRWLSSSRPVISSKPKPQNCRSLIAPIPERTVSRVPEGR